MTFVTAAFVTAGLAAMTLPILIHLLSRQRRRPIEWAAMRFLMEAFRKHRRRLQLEQLLLLAVRCLIVAMFGFALAQPLLKNAGMLDIGGSRTVWLVIDNGLAAGVQGATDEGGALDRHVASAISTVDSLKPGDTVGVITAARPARVLLNPPSTNHAGVRQLLSTLSGSEAATDIPGAMGLLGTVLNDEQRAGERQVAYLFSEFRAGSARLDSPLPELPIRGSASVQLVASAPSTQTLGNVQIVSVEPVRNVVLAGQDEGTTSISVKLARQGGGLDRQLTKVRLEGSEIARVEPRIVQWQPGQTEAETEFSARVAVSGDRKLLLTARIDNDALMADNQRHAVLDLRGRIRVLMVDRRSFGFEPTLDRLTPGQWMQRALEPLGSDRTGAIEVVQVEPAALAAADVRAADAAIVPRPDLMTDVGWRLLRGLADRGGIVLVCPPTGLTVHGWAEQFTAAFDVPWTIALETANHEEAPLGVRAEAFSAGLLRLLSSELEELVRPVLVFRSLPVNAADSNAPPVLSLSDGSPVLMVDQPGGTSNEQEGGARGMVMYLATAPALTWTNLPTKPLMVPLMQELMRQGLSEVRLLERFLVGDQPRLNLWPGAATIVAGQPPIIPVDADRRIAQPLERSGVYTIRDRAEQTLGLLAVNVDPLAGSTTANSRDEVALWLRGSGPWQWISDSDVVKSGMDDEGAPLATMLLLAVVALVLLETLLARWFSHAKQGGGTGLHVRGIMPSMHNLRPAEASVEGGAA